MTKKSTKTSHVLNLIANKNETSTVAEETPSSSTEKKSVSTVNETLSVDNIEITADEVSIKADEINNYESPLAEKNNSPTSKGTDAPRREVPIIQVENKSNDPVAEQIKQELEKAAAGDIRDVQNAQQESLIEAELQQDIQQSTEELDEESETLDAEEMPQAAPEIHPLPLEDFDITAENFAQRPYINIVENIVRSKAIATMQRLGMCTCDKCVNDVIALTLNMLPPKYVVSDTGRLYAKLSSYEKQYSANMLAAIAKACVRIQKNPRH